MASACCWGMLKLMCLVNFCPAAAQLRTACTAPAKGEDLAAPYKVQAAPLACMCIPKSHMHNLHPQSSPGPPSCSFGALGGQSNHQHEAA